MKGIIGLQLHNCMPKNDAFVDNRVSYESYKDGAGYSRRFHYQFDRFWAIVAQKIHSAGGGGLYGNFDPNDEEGWGTWEVFIKNMEDGENIEAEGNPMAGLHWDEVQKVLGALKDDRVRIVLIIEEDSDGDS